MTEALLEVREVSKVFSGNTALDRVSLEVLRGEVVALLGHNGSGKSTLVKVLSGHYTRDHGDIRRGPAGDSRLHFIHQNLGLVAELTVTENLDISTKRKWWGLGPINGRMERSRTTAMLETFRVPIDPDAKVASLTPAERTIVAIVRALDGWQGTEDHVLVLDEPTAALHGEEVEVLKNAVRTVASRGAGVIYITHRLAEAVELADRAIVLKNGKVVAEQARGTFDHSSLIRIIAGSGALHGDRRQDVSATTDMFTVRHLRDKSLNDINFDAGSGEILGIAGVVGSGMEQLNGTIFGAASRQSGAVMLEGQIVRSDDPTASIDAGIAYVPADRRAHGSFGQFSAMENITLPRLSDLRKPWGMIDRNKEEHQVRGWIDRLQVRPRGRIEQAFELFSGGNQQKIVLAKWLRTRPKVLLIDEPTQGVDVVAQAEIYGLLADAAAQGAVVIVSSTDVKELVAICHRVLVLRDGKVAASFSGEALQETNLVAAILADGSSD